MRPQKEDGRRTLAIGMIYGEEGLAGTGFVLRQRVRVYQSCRLMVFKLHCTASSGTFHQHRRSARVGGHAFAHDPAIAAHKNPCWRLWAIEQMPRRLIPRPARRQSCCNPCCRQLSTTPVHQLRHQVAGMSRESAISFWAPHHPTISVRLVKDSEAFCE